MAFHVISSSVVKKVFLICPNEFLICAEDAYLTFLTVHFANSYIVKKTDPYYTYRLGSGVSTSKVTIQNFCRSVDGVKVTKWLEDYFIGKGEYENYQQIIYSLRRWLFIFIVNGLKEIRDEDLFKAFSYMFNTGYTSDIVFTMARRYIDDYKSLFRFSVVTKDYFQPIISNPKTVAVIYHRYYMGRGWKG